MLKALFGDWLAMTKPHSVHLTRKKDINPFEDSEPLEYLSKKQDVSAYARVYLYRGLSDSGEPTKKQDMYRGVFWKWT